LLFICVRVRAGNVDSVTERVSRQRRIAVAPVERDLLTDPARKLEALLRVNKLDLGDYQSGVQAFEAIDRPNKTVTVAYMMPPLAYGPRRRK
jgi:hypothetical protein